MFTHPHFKTERLLIRPIDKDDAAFVLELMNTPKWIKNIGDRHVNTIKEAETYINEKALPQLEKYGYGNNVIVKIEDQTKLGTCGLYHREDREDPDIGFAFLPNFIGKGYAFEAAQRLMVAAKESYGLSDLSAYTLNTNLGSKKLLERLGFSVKGLSRLPNNEEELLHYFCTLTEAL